MFWIVLTVVAVLVGVCALGYAFFSDFSDQDKAIGVVVAGGTFVIWVVVTALFMVENVGARQVGIVHNFSGTITGSIGQGTSLIAPWTSVSTENVGLQNEDFKLDSSNSAVSQDQQPIYGDIQLNYSVGANGIINLYKTVGPGWKLILLEGRMLQDFKQVTSTYTAAEITTKRAQLRADTRALMEKELAKYDITVNDVLIKNISYSQAYLEAISDKNVQVQKSKQAQAKVAQVQAEADQAAARAAGEARATVLTATAAAKALTLKGKALHDNPEILQLEAIDKLNPNAEVIICTGTGSSNCPSFLPTGSTSKP